MEDNSSQLRDDQRPVYPQTVASWPPTTIANPDLGKGGPTDALKQLASEEYGFRQGNAIAGGSRREGNSVFQTAESQSLGGGIVDHLSGFNTSWQALLGFVESGGNYNALGMETIHPALNADSRPSGLEAPNFGMDSQGFSLQLGLPPVPVLETLQCANTDNMYPAFPYDLNAPATDASNSNILGSGTPDLSHNIGGNGCTVAESFELQKNLSELVDNQASTISTITGENFEPEKALGEQTDLSKGKKPRKKKHRPKVVVEGKKPRNPRTPKPTNLNGVGTPKRKYVRKNPVNKPVDGALEGEPNKAMEDPGAEAVEKSRGHVRQKKVDQSTAPLEGQNTTSTATGSRTTRVSRRSSRKTLNFNNESQEEWGGVGNNQLTASSSGRRGTLRKSLNFGIGSQVEGIGSQAGESRCYHQPPSDFEIKYSEGKEVLVEKTNGDSVQAVPNEYPFVKESQARTATSCLSSQFTGPDQIEATRGSPIFPYVAHDDQVSILKTCATGNAERIASGYKRSSGTKQGTQARDSKRTRVSTADAMDPSNLTGAGSCSVLAYQQMLIPAEYHSNMQFPAVFENQRSATTYYQSASSSMPPTYQIHPSDDGALQSDSMFQMRGNGRKGLPSIGIAGKITRKRSKGMTRARNAHSLLEDVRQLPTSGNGKGAFRGSRGPHACMEALADFSKNLARKKRSNRTIFGSASGSASGSYDHHRSATEFFGVHAGSSLDSMGRGKSMIDAIIEQFSYLSIEGRRSHINYQEANAWQNSIVLYQNIQNNGALVPFDSQFNQLRKRKPRPKVELDEETTRVWKLLLEDINSEGVDGTDEQKAKWWEAEREVFRLRTESFIARMHLVQGDRRFTPWKGSVVDSVVGVFLTQNVSDHLSSSAFISMAARYPLKSRNTNDKSPLSEKRSVEPEVVEPNEEVEWSKEESSPVDRINGSMTLADKKCSEEDINTRIYLGSSSEGTKTACPSSLSSLSSGCGTKLFNRADANRCESSSQSSTDAEHTDAASTHPSFVELMQQMAEPFSHGNYNPGVMKASSYLESSIKSKDSCNFFQGLNLGSQETITSDGCRFFGVSKETELSVTEQSGSPPESSAGASCPNSLSQKHQILKDCGDKEPASRVQKQEAHKIGAGSNAPSSSRSDTDNSGKRVAVEMEKKQKVGSNSTGPSNRVGTAEAPDASKENKKKTTGKQKKVATDWDSLRKQAEANGKKERPLETMDSVDWERVRCADVDEIAYTIRERGMNNMLAERIKDFLNRIVKDHGSIDLEWLRDIEPDRAKEYLLSVRGLGLKSVECVRLLTLHHLAFPVDTNVGRIAVRLGWVPLQPLPESLQLHLLELYPVLESIQKYLWPRLCKLDQPTLYELHYQLITFGKVFCTKSKPNCNSCPMRAECRHFASAYASARLALPAPEERSIISATQNETFNKNASENNTHLQLPQPEAIQQLEGSSQVRSLGPIIEEPTSPEPIVEEPATPEPEKLQPEGADIEESVHEDETDIPEIKLNLEELNQTLQDYIQMHIQVQDSEMSKALVVVDAEAASLPMPKLKSINRLRTEHQVYELPDTHPLLKGFERREPDDPSPYLLAIWTPGETVDSIKPPESTCSCFQDSGKLCNQQTCFSCNSIREANSQTVRGTLLIPCRTAMRGSFPLNGTYFQVNEMFADHESSQNPISVPRDWLWNLPRRMVYFGTSVPSIFKGLTQSEIQFCFWKGFVCVRGFDKRIRAPRPLIARLHFPASKLKRERGDE